MKKSSLKKASAKAALTASQSKTQTRVKVKNLGSVIVPQTRGLLQTS